MVSGLENQQQTRCFILSKYLKNKRTWRLYTPLIYRFESISKAAYDFVSRENHDKALRGLQILGKLINLSKVTMEGVTYAIKIRNAASEKITTDNSLVQGDALACLLSKKSLEEVIRDANVSTRGTIFNSLASSLRWRHRHNWQIILRLFTVFLN